MIKTPVIFRLFTQTLSVMVIAMTLAIPFISCNNHNDHQNTYGADIDTLKVVTLYGPTSYFLYRDQIMGIDYDNVSRFAQDEGMVLDIRAVDNMQDLIAALESGQAHMAAYPVPSIAEYNSKVKHAGHKEISRQVLVQRNTPDKVTDVTQLVGKEIHVEKDSKYQYRLENLNDELGGGIIITTVANDTIDSEDLLKMVNSGQIEYTVIDSQLASLYQSAFPHLDTSLGISADQAASWVVALGLDSLANKIDAWENRTHASDFVKEIYKRYYDQAINEDFDTNLSYFTKLNLSKGASVSAYDNLFKSHAKTAGYDWPLLAAIAYCESRFNPTVESRFGAYGLMQVMPATAKAVGVEPSALSNPDANVRAAAKIIAKLDNAFINKVHDKDERLKFVIAAYNSGLGHIYDAMALADKLGLDSQKWVGNVSVAALMKSRPEYYNDPVVKHGYFRGRETVNFVDHVSGIYNYIQNQLSNKKS